MRFSVLGAVWLGLLGAAYAQPISNASASLFAERAALLAADSKCTLLAAPVRSALSATTTQARAGAVRAGWSDARLDEVSTRAMQAGRERDCLDPMVTEAVQRATAGYVGWSKQQGIDLPGQSRSWRVRRLGDVQGWVLAQDLTPTARFGLKFNANHEPVLVMTAPVSEFGVSSSVQVNIRDRARAPRPLLNIPGVIAVNGLAAGAAPRSLAAGWIASAITVERTKDTPAKVVITFPPALLAEMAALDPREAAEIVLTRAGETQRLYIEIGDLNVARAFLTAGAS